MRALSRAVVFRNILCPIDFTTFSHRALETAVAIAQSFGATVTALYVADAEQPSATAAWRLAWTPEDLQRIQVQVLKVLQEVKAPSARAVAMLGTPALEIEKLARALPADLIVLPSCRRTGRTEHTCGSVTSHVLCHAPTPVLIVPDEGDAAPVSAPPDGFHRIACGINFSPASLKALRYAGDLAAAGQGQLFVTHVLSVEEASAVSTKDLDSTGIQDATSLWRRRLHEASRTDLPQGVHVEDRLRIGDPAEEILRLAQEERCDLIAIGGHRGNPPGCVMNVLVSQSPCPVLTVRIVR